MTAHLVGAGPGDPELLTMRAHRLVQQADVIIHDRLVSDEILGLAPPWAEMIPVGKNPDGPTVTQDVINLLLIDRARSNKTVVRLKGGDPFVFGRGGEEALALDAAGLGYEIVPGISSSTAGPLLAGIPVTHRGVSTGFTVVTGTTAATNTDSNWQALARSGTTLVVLMGARRAAAIASRLIAAGMPAATPAAIVTWAATPRQSVRRLPLAALGREPVPNPSVIVVGDVAALELTGSHTDPEPDPAGPTPTPHLDDPIPAARPMTDTPPPIPSLLPR